MYILRASITLKDGSKIYAKDYGKRAFRIWVGPGPEPIKKQITENDLKYIFSVGYTSIKNKKLGEE